MSQSPLYKIFVPKRRRKDQMIVGRGIEEWSWQRWSRCRMKNTRVWVHKMNWNNKHTMLAVHNGALQTYLRFFTRNIILLLKLSHIFYYHYSRFSFSVFGMLWHISPCTQITTEEIQLSKTTCLRNVVLIQLPHKDLECQCFEVFMHYNKRQVVILFSNNGGVVFKRACSHNCL